MREGANKGRTKEWEVKKEGEADSSTQNLLLPVVCSKNVCGAIISDFNY